MPTHPPQPAHSGHPHKSLRDRFVDFAKAVARIVGSPWSFLLALVIIAVWAFTGPMFRFSDTWQLVINTGTTIVTFLMVFLIQNSQNRDAKAIHLKLDELIRSSKGARNDLVLLEDMSEEELDTLATQFQSLRDRACRMVEHRKAHKHAPGKHLAPAGADPAPTHHAG